MAESAQANLEPEAKAAFAPGGAAAGEGALTPPRRGLLWHLTLGRAVRRQRRRAALDLYTLAVGWAREPKIYRDWGLPDTNDGRLEMIGLHAWPLMRRLRGLGVRGQDTAQELFNVMIGDIDTNFREQGVGDLSVGKHVKAAAKTFLAKAQALDGPMDAGDAGGIARVVERNAFTAGGTPDPEGLEALARRALALDRALARHDPDGLLAGQVRLPGGWEELPAA